MAEFTVTAIGHVHNERTTPEDDDWDSVVSTIVLDDEWFTPDVVAGLADFSHLDVVFLFDRVDPDKINLGARHPRNREDWPLVGIFAQHRVAANLLMIMMILAGVWALTKLNTQFFPNFELDFITVRVVWSGAAAEDVEQSITDPLERELRREQPGVEHRESRLLRSSTAADLQRQLCAPGLS